MAGLLLLLASCSSVDHAAFDRYQKESSMALTQGDAPAGAEPLSLVYSSKSGFYLFAILPIVKADLTEALDLLVAEARKLGADGIAHLQISYKPASLIGFETWPIPFPWVATVSLTGMAWKKGK